MNRVIKTVIIGLLLMKISLTVSAQQHIEQSVWSSWLSSFKVKGNWALHFDLQLRSADELKYFRQMVIRPGLTYNFNKQQNITLGYAYVETFRRLDGIADNDITENRMWALHRFRIEQRFIERPGNANLFSQRFRYFARFTIPFKKQEEAFQRGSYIALQNEVFLHLQNKDQLNRNVFDQNRGYLAFGFRLNPKADLEIGYLNQYLKGTSNSTINNIAQLGLITRF